MSPELPRLLLVEFVAGDGWAADGRFFPFFAGHARGRGLPCRWLLFGADRAREGREDGGEVSGFALPAEEEEVLAAAVKALRPTHVLLSDTVSRGVLDVLLSASASARVLSMGAGLCHPPAVNLFSYVHEHPMGRPEGGRASGAEEGLPSVGSDSCLYEWAKGRTNWFLMWLGAPSRSADEPFDRYIVDAFPPDYRAVPGNARFAERGAPVLLLGGSHCGYLAPVRDNPFFVGVDLDGVTHDVGCTFCTEYRGPVSEPGEDAFALARRQLSAMARAPRGETRALGRIHVRDVRLQRAPERFFSIVASLAMPPTVFVFQPHLKDVPGLLDSLRGPFDELARAGHVVLFETMGAESFADEENARYGKGLDRAAIQDAFAAMARAAVDFPQTFRYDETPSVITCSPWTTLSTLRATITGGIALGLDPRGWWLHNPLLLGHGAPIARLARRERDILREEVPDASLVWDAVNRHVDQTSVLPWGFRDERVGRAFALIVRFCAAVARVERSDAVFAGDASYEAVRRFVRDREEKGLANRPDLFALAVVDAVEQAEPPEGDAELAEAQARYAALLEREPPKPHARGATERPHGEERARVAYLLDAVFERYRDTLGPLEAARARAWWPSGEIEIVVEWPGEERRLTLLPRARAEKAWVVTRRYAVSYGGDEARLPPPAPRAVRRLVGLLERAIERHAPSLLGDGDS